jgi:hypothetical protein
VLYISFALLSFTPFNIVQHQSVRGGGNISSWYVTWWIIRAIFLGCCWRNVMTVHLEVVPEGKPACVRRPTYIALELERRLATAPLLMRFHMLANSVEGGEWSVAFHTGVWLRVAVLVPRQLDQCVELLWADRTPEPDIKLMCYSCLQGIRCNWQRTQEGNIRHTC